jgi:hypothetical protein
MLMRGARRLSSITIGDCAPGSSLDLDTQTAEQAPPSALPLPHACT